MDKGSHRDYTDFFRRLGNPADTEAALREIYALFYRELIQYITRFVGKDTELVKDLVNDVLMELCEHPEKFADRRDPKQWLLTIAKYKTWAHLRRAERLPTEPLDEDFNFMGDLFADSRLNDEELEQFILKAADRLTPMQREVFLCRWEEGLSNAEIAERYGLVLQTVKNHMTAGIGKIGEELSSYLGMI